MREEERFGGEIWYPKEIAKIPDKNFEDRFESRGELRVFEVFESLQGVGFLLNESFRIGDDPWIHGRREEIKNGKLAASQLLLIVRSRQGKDVEDDFIRFMSQEVVHGEDEYLLKKADGGVEEFVSDLDSINAYSCFSEGRLVRQVLQLKEEHGSKSTTSSEFYYADNPEGEELVVELAVSMVNGSRRQEVQTIYLPDKDDEFPLDPRRRDTLGYFRFDTNQNLAIQHNVVEVGDYEVMEYRFFQLEEKPLEIILSRDIVIRDSLPTELMTYKAEQATSEVSGHFVLRNVGQGSHRGTLKDIQNLYSFMNPVFWKSYEELIERSREVDTEAELSLAIEEDALTGSKETNVYYEGSEHPAEFVDRSAKTISVVHDKHIIVDVERERQIIILDKFNRVLGVLPFTKGASLDDVRVN